MAAKRSASTAPAAPLRRSKRLAQQPIEEPSDSLASQNVEGPVEDPEPEQGNGDRQQDVDMGIDIDIDMGDDVEELDEELYFEGSEEEMEAEEVDVEGNTSRQDRIERRRKILRQMDLPDNIFEQVFVDWLDILLAASEASMGMQVKIREFAARLRDRENPKSLVDVTDFRNDTGRVWWHSHCLEMDTAWDKYLEGLAEILGEEGGDFDITTLSKPSGPLGAILHMQWHYPTWTTAKSIFHFAHVMDPGNCSLRQHDVKIGHTPDVSTSDMIPIREASRDPNWADIFGSAKWPAIKRLSLDFNYAIMKSSPVVVLVGSSCFTAFDAKLRADDSIRLTKVRLGISTKVFKQDPFFYVVKDRQDGQIRQLVFYSHHGSRFLYQVPVQEGIYTDLIWNAAAAITNVDVLSPGHFSWATTLTSKERVQKGPRKRKRQTANDEELREVLLRNLAIGRESQKARGSYNTDTAMKAAKVARDSLRLAKTRAILSSVDVRYLLRHEISYYGDYTNLKNAYQLFAKLRGWPDMWETLSHYRKRGFRTWVQGAHTYFTKLRAIEEDPSTTESTREWTTGLEKYALWYHKDKHPYGLRWEGDGGPKAFAQDIRDAIQRNHTANMDPDSIDNGDIFIDNGDEDNSS
ncbi:hypothetical protein V8C40DRAFT_276504 [Trichoderma camerunense]